MTAMRHPKKTETIEIRLADEAKSAFVAHCRAHGRTASETVRELIDQRLATPRAAHRPVRAWRAWVAGLVGIGLGAGVAAPSLAHSTPVDRASFDRLDRDHDGRLSFAEYRAR